MQNFDKAVEKYRRELLEFSKQSKAVFADEEMIEEEIAEEIQTKTEDEIPVKQVIAEPKNTIIDEIKENDNTAISVADEPINTYADFLAKNSSKGQMKVQVTIAGTIPLPNANVTVSVDLPDGSRELYNGYTDIDGIIDPINLPAPPVSLSFDENSTVVPYAVYNVKVTHPDFSPAEFKNAPVFDSIKSIQPVTLVPITENGDTPGSTIVPNQPMELFGGEN